MLLRLRVLLISFVVLMAFFGCSPGGMTPPMSSRIIFEHICLEIPDGWLKYPRSYYAGDRTDWVAFEEPHRRYPAYIQFFICEDDRCENDKTGLAAVIDAEAFDETLDENAISSLEFREDIQRIVVKGRQGNVVISFQRKVVGKDLVAVTCSYMASQGLDRLCQRVAESMRECCPIQKPPPD